VKCADEHPPTENNVNIGQIAKMAQQMQAQMAQVQAELRDATVEATAGGGAVRVVVSGAQELRAIEIDPAAVRNEFRAEIAV